MTGRRRAGKKILQGEHGRLKSDSAGCEAVVLELPRFGRQVRACILGNTQILRFILYRGLYQPSMNSKTAVSASSRVHSLTRSISSHSKVAKNDSHIALS